MSTMQHVLNDLAAGWTIGFVLACVLLTVAANIAVIL